MTSTRFARPRITTLEAPHAPIALPYGRTPIRVAVVGSGRLVVGDVVRWVDGALAEVLLVRASTLIRARFVGPLGRDDRALYLAVPLGAPASPPVRFPPILNLGARARIRMRAVALPHVALRPEIVRPRVTPLVPDPDGETR